MTTGKRESERCLVDLSKLRIADGRIHYFLYQQHGGKQAMDCADTLENRRFVSWAQIHDAPFPKLKEPVYHD